MQQKQLLIYKKGSVKMIEIIFRNLFILYLGTLLRFLFHRVIKRKKISYHQILNGIEHEKTKEDEIFNIRNEFINRLYGLGFLLFVVVIIIIIQWR